MAGYLEERWGEQEESWITHPQIRLSKLFAGGTLITLFLVSSIFGVGFFAFFGLFLLASLFLVSFVALIVVGMTRAFDQSETGRSRKWFAMGAPLGLLATAAFTLPVLWSGDWINVRWTYALVKSDIEKIYQNPRPQTDVQTDFGHQYRIDAVKAVRIAYSRGGFLDNWLAIVYDPTDEVKKARGFDDQGNFTAPPSIRSIFGGDLVECSNIYGHFYDCSFT